MRAPPLGGQLQGAGSDLQLAVNDYFIAQEGGDGGEEMPQATDDDDNDEGEEEDECAARLGLG